MENYKRKIKKIDEKYKKKEKIANIQINLLLIFYGLFVIFLFCIGSGFQPSFPDGIHVVYEWSSKDCLDNLWILLIIPLPFLLTFLTGKICEIISKFYKYLRS